MDLLAQHPTKDHVAIAGVGHSHLHHLKLREGGQQFSLEVAAVAKESQEHFPLWELHKVSVAFEVPEKGVKGDMNKTEDAVHGVK